MDKTVTDLSGTWRISYLDNKTVTEKHVDPKTVSEVEAIGNALDAAVPGDFLLTLHRAGILPDPYFGNNSWEYQKYEYTHVWYCTDFTVENRDTDRLYFDFEGLDTVCEIYLNGNLIGKTDNMFIPHAVKANGIIAGKNELVVHFIPVMVAAREKRLPLMCHTLFYSFEALYTRKPMHSYGWDIMPRILSCGIYKPVTLRERANDSIDELHLFTLRADAEKRTARVRIYFALNLSADNPREYRIEIDGKCGSSTFHEECCPHHTEYTRLAFGIENCRLWWPKNHGEQNLYDVVARLWHGDELVDIKTMKFGIRTAELIRTDAIRDGVGDFTFRINGRPIFCLGTNWVPMSPFHCEDEQRQPRALELLDESGCNMVRVWGGSVYPDDGFYDFCDEHGIMVWQDFALACAVYPQDEEFCKKIETEATAVVKRLRHHASLVLWAGDNECDSTCEGWNGYRRDPNDNVITRRVLPEVIRNHDFTRQYLPSSPYVSPEAYRDRLPTPEAHLWDSDRYYFKKDYYKKATCYFASEIGYHGCPSPSSLRKFIGEDKLWPINDENGKPNLHWLAHTSEAQDDGELSYVYRAGLHQKEVRYLFGSLPDTVDEYALLSQISQAEAFKYFVESFRAKKWRRTGILWWNLLDGWPQVADAVVDYYYHKKMAFEYLKRSQSPLCLMLNEQDDGTLTLIAANDTCTDMSGSYSVTNVTEGKKIAQGDFSVDNNENIPLTSINADQSYAVYMIEWTAGGQTYRNHYTSGIIGMDAGQYMRDMKKIGFDDYTE